MLLAIKPAHSKVCVKASGSSVVCQSITDKANKLVAKKAQDKALGVNPQRQAQASHSKLVTNSING